MEATTVRTVGAVSRLSLCLCCALRWERNWRGSVSGGIVHVGRAQAWSRVRAVCRPFSADGEPRSHESAQSQGRDSTDHSLASRSFLVALKRNTIWAETITVVNVKQLKNNICK